MFLKNFITSGRKVRGRSAMQLVWCNVGSVMLVVACSVFVVLSLLRLPRDPSQFFVLVLNLASIAAAIAIVLLLRLRKFPLVLGRSFCIFLESALCFLLAASGGEDGTGFYWSYIIPPVAFFLLGLRPGAFFSLIYMLAVTVGAMHGPAHWSALQGRHFIYSFLSECVTIFIYELERIRSRRRLSSANARIHRSLEKLARANQEVERANQAKSDFLAVMSHEIRTPMSSVMGMAMLLSEKETEPESREYVGTILSASQSLLSIVNDTLDLARLEAGRMELHERNFSLPKLLGEVGRLAQPECATRGIFCRMDLPEGLPTCFRGDEGRLRQVLLNLVSNGVKFTVQGGVTVHVEVAGRADSDGRMPLKFRVEDTGRGISPAKLKQLFQPFTSSEAAATGSSGLGLSICKRLVDLMGGEVGVDSEEGKGSEFCFQVPLLPVEAADDFPASAVMRPLSILLADDDRVNRRIVMNLLKKSGHLAEAAEDGSSALKKLASARFDLLITDLHMPDMGGMELLQRVRAGEAGPDSRNLPVVALTASIMDSERQACLDAGMLGFLVKPVSREDLQSLLNGIFRAGKV